MNRRQVTSRSNAAIRGLAAALSRTAITPNQISVFSVVASLLVPVGLYFLNGWAAVSLAIAGIQLRLLANVVDGLVAVEGGKSSPAGALYNEFPDRIADSVILVSLGYFAQVPELGWLAALLATGTAYIRVFGGALGQAQDFRGPMAKQHRMAFATAGLLATPLWPTMAPAVLTITLGIICAGSFWTCVNRTRGIVARLTAGAHP
jgi:phosphatidylglycerophosphate synthase